MSNAIQDRIHANCARGHQPRQEIGPLKRARLWQSALRHQFYLHLRLGLNYTFKQSPAQCLDVNKKQRQ